MKKRLEADLVSIAHKILQLKNKSDIDQLFFETQKLYEKLTVLRFIENQYGDTKPSIGKSEMVADLENYIENTLQAPEVLPQEILTEKKEIPTIVPVSKTIVETPPIAVVAQENIPTEAPENATPPVEQKVTEEEREVVAVKNSPIEEIKETIKLAAPILSPLIDKIKNSSFGKTSDKEEPIIENKSIVAESIEEKPSEETAKKTETDSFSLKELIGDHFYNEPQFVKKSEDVSPPDFKTVVEKEAENIPKTIPTEVVKPTFAKQSSSLNDRFSKKIEIDLNDQIAFVKHLFDNKIEDYNRALSQINTLETYQETKSFVARMIKPDHNNWKDKTEYEERFMHCIEKKFL